jgi:hypothetical protein
MHVCGRETDGGCRRQVLTNVCLRNPTRFDGAILVCPMLGIEEAVRPHPLIETVLRSVIAPLIPTWPITPGENVVELLLHDPADVRTLFDVNEYGPGDAKLRLGTAVSMISGCDIVQERLADFATPFLVLHGVGLPVRPLCVTVPFVCACLFSVASGYPRTMYLSFELQLRAGLHVHPAFLIPALPCNFVFCRSTARGCTPSAFMSHCL